MKKLVLLLLALLGTNCIFSQDLIVTTSNDSIHCKIAKIAPDTLYFTIPEKTEPLSKLPMTEIKNCQFGFFLATTTSDGATVIIPEDTVGEVFDKVRFSINGGYTYFTQRIPSGASGYVEEYMRKLKSGFHANGQLDYFYSQKFGVGIRVSFSRTNSKGMSLTLVDTTGNQFTGNITEKISIYYVGAAFSYRIYDDKKRNPIIMGFSAGYMRYSNSMSYDRTYKIIGNTVGASIDLGYDITLSEQMGVGFQISYYGGALFRYTVNNQYFALRKGEWENLHRLDFSVGLRF
ncbi:autotransporter outer membrane beta-barrel domain-containing protein [Bacteroidales bacterium OttesenSCG-928-B11]|nr:autotransporter outer membrane beta-barrel domain-containing protein [Bacteroidales bacterium OttesenSCG-928-C03]MDL2312510.1 autotransporter outer membrane beta-barrel domain-containing protein [Bacteroidales bacterium OttesenSCG-928-B11]